MSTKAKTASIIEDVMSCSIQVNSSLRVISTAPNIAPGLAIEGIANGKMAVSVLSRTLFILSFGFAFTKNHRQCKKQQHYAARNLKSRLMEFQSHLIKAHQLQQKNSSTTADTPTALKDDFALKFIIFSSGYCDKYRYSSYWVYHRKKEDKNG